LKEHKIGEVKKPSASTRETRGVPGGHREGTKTGGESERIERGKPPIKPP